MARIIEGKIFHYRFGFGSRVLPGVVIEASDVDDADKAILLHAASHPDYKEEDIKILSVNEIDLGTTN